MHSVGLNRRSPPRLSLVAGRQSSDADLACALKDGESWALGETWYRFAPMVLSMSERCLGSRAEADDVTQEVFYRVFRKANTLRDPNSLRSFVYSFAIRVLRTELRRRKLRSWLSFDHPGGFEDVGGASVDVEARDSLRRLHALLDRLSPRDRLVFVLRRMECMTVDEIAKHTRLSESTVKRSLTHASTRLAKWIDAEPGLLDLIDTSRSK